MGKHKTLQEIADEQGISRQAVWMKTEKGKAYQKAYQKRIMAIYNKYKHLEQKFT